MEDVDTIMQCRRSWRAKFDQTNLAIVKLEERSAKFPAVLDLIERIHHPRVKHGLRLSANTCSWKTRKEFAGALLHLLTSQDGDRLD